MLVNKSVKMVADPAQLALLRRLPRHSGALAHLGIRLPKDAIILVGSEGIKIVLPKQNKEETIQA